MSTTFQHPWYVALQKAENTTDSDALSKQKQKQEELGLTYIKYKDPEAIVWAAGLFEGEGTLVHRKDDTWYIKVGMTDEDVVRTFASIWDLKVSGPYMYSKKRPNDKLVYEAKTAARDKILEVISDIYPDLHERRRAKCDEFINWYQNKCLS